MDTKPLLKLFAQEEGWEAVQRILLKVEAGEVEAAISVVTLTELCYKYLQEGRGDLAKTRTGQLRSAPHLRKLEISEEAAVKAGELKGRYPVPIADAFVAAAACLEGATVVSDDPDFKKIREVKTKTEREILPELP